MRPNDPLWAYAQMNSQLRERRGATGTWVPGTRLNGRHQLLASAGPTLSTSLTRLYRCETSLAPIVLLEFLRRGAWCDSCCALGALLHGPVGALATSQDAPNVAGVKGLLSTKLKKSKSSTPPSSGRLVMTQDTKSKCGNRALKVGM